MVDEDDDGEPDALIALPSEIGDIISTGDNVRCSFTTFADPALFQSPSLTVNENSTGSYRAANSPVISATVGGSVINGLTEPVIVSFKPLNSVRKYLALTKLSNQMIKIQFLQITFFTRSHLQFNVEL